MSAADSCVSTERYKLIYLCFDTVYCGKCRLLWRVWISLYVPTIVLKTFSFLILKPVALVMKFKRRCYEKTIGRFMLKTVQNSIKSSQALVTWPPSRRFLLRPLSFFTLKRHECVVSWDKKNLALIQRGKSHRKNWLPIWKSLRQAKRKFALLNDFRCCRYVKDAVISSISV